MIAAVAGATETSSAVVRGLAYLTRFQTASRSVRGEYDGPLFLSPGYVFAHHATGTSIPARQRAGLVECAERVQNPDGGFGLHVEGPSTLGVNPVLPELWLLRARPRSTPLASGVTRGSSTSRCRTCTDAAGRSRRIA